MRNISAYVKILSLAALIGILYWRDLVALQQAALSIEWIGFTLIVVSLVFVFLYQRRKALKTLVLVSESNNKRGAVFLLLAITLYIFGSYAPYIWLHLCSMILFIIAYLTLRFDFRIPRMLFMPFTALLFIVAPPIKIRLFGVWDILSLVRFIVIAIFLVYILKASRLWKSAVIYISGRGGVIEGFESCPLCQSTMMRGEAFCLHCGKQRLPLKPTLTRFAIAKFFILLLIVCILAFIYIPVFSLTDQRAAVMLYTPHGTEHQSILQTPQGWVLESSNRLTDHESLFREDFIVLNRYASERYAENKSYILMEIGSQPPYMMDSWQLLGWRRHRETVWITENVMGQYVVLLKQNNTMTVLYWVMEVLFKIDSVYSTRQVGVSIFMNFSEPLIEQENLPFALAKTSKILTELRSMGVSIIESWKPISLVTLHASTLNEICTRFKDVFLTILAVVGVFFFAGWVRAKDERVEKLIENAFPLLESEGPLLVAVSTLKRRKFVGAEVFEVYKGLARTGVDVNRFYEKLNKFLRFNLLKRGYVLKNHELIMAWERTFP